jgi:hypothetical protein
LRQKRKKELRIKNTMTKEIQSTRTYKAITYPFTLLPTQYIKSNHSFFFYQYEYSKDSLRKIWCIKLLIFTNIGYLTPLYQPSNK